MDIFYTVCHLGTKIVVPTLPEFQGIKSCVQLIDINPDKTIAYTFNYYGTSNVINLMWIGDKIQYYTNPGPVLSTRSNLARARACGAGSPRTVKHCYLPGLGRDKTLMMRTKD